MCSRPSRLVVVNRLSYVSDSTVRSDVEDYDRDTIVYSSSGYLHCCNLLHALHVSMCLQENCQTAWATWDDAVPLATADDTTETHTEQGNLI